MIGLLQWVCLCVRLVRQLRRSLQLFNRSRRTAKLTKAIPVMTPIIVTRPRQWQSIENPSKKCLFLSCLLFKHIMIMMLIETKINRSLIGYLLPSVLWRCWLGGRKGIRPVKNGGVLVWFSVWSKVQTCIWPSWCHCHSLSLASVKSRLVLPFWYWITWVVLEKGPLNGWVCVLLVISVYHSDVCYAANRVREYRCCVFIAGVSQKWCATCVHTHTHNRLTAFCPGLPG